MLSTLNNNFRLGQAAQFQALATAQKNNKAESAKAKAAREYIQSGISLNIGMFVGDSELNMTIKDGSKLKFRSGFAPVMLADENNEPSAVALAFNAEGFEDDLHLIIAHIRGGEIYKYADKLPQELQAIADEMLLTESSEKDYY